MLSYENIFQTRQDLTDQIKTATARLLTVKGRELEETALQVWPAQLWRYQPVELAAAFNRAELQIRAFPDLADIVDFIEKPRFHDAFALVLQGLAKHGVDWQRIPGMREVAPGHAAIRPDDPSTFVVLRDPVEPPELPRRIIQALEIFGQIGTMRGGLVRLKRDHPVFWTGDTEFTTGQHGRQASMIEKELYQAWQEAG